MQLRGNLMALHQYYSAFDTSKHFNWNRLALCWGMHFSPIAVQINLTRKIRKEKKRKYNKGKQQQQQ